MQDTLSSDHRNDDAALVSLLDAGLILMGLELKPAQKTQLIRFIDLLHKWNRVYNLTAVRDKKTMVSRHILDSLSALPIVQRLGDNSIILDVGTGAGIPVIPLAICCPQISFVSVESIGKKTRFQLQALQQLQIKNVDVVQQRIEDVECQANVVISRAFAAPERFLTTVSGHMSKEGLVVIMLGLKDKLPDALPAGYSLIRVQAVTVPGESAERHLALCRYAATT